MPPKRRSSKKKGGKGKQPEQINSIDNLYYILKSYVDSHDKFWTKHQIDSYNEFVNRDMGEIIRQFNPIVLKIENSKKNIDVNEQDIRYFKNIIEFGQEYIKRPHHTDANGSKTVVFPQMARDKNLTYQSVVSCDIKHKIIAIRKDDKEILIKDIENKDVTIGHIPVMVHSDLCNIQKLPKDALVKIGEDPNDPGGYFIINGNEKVVIAKERKNMNHVYFFDNTNKASTTWLYTCEIKSQIEGKFECAHVATVKMDKKSRIVLALNPGFQKKDIPIFIMFRALGVITDKEIIEYITYNTSDDNMIELLKPSMLHDIIDANLPEDKNHVQSQEDALMYLANRIVPISMDYLNTQEKRIKYVMTVFDKHLFPHVGESLDKKAYFLGYMIRKLLLGKMGVVKTDDRDNLANKRIDTTGVLISYFFKYQMNLVIEGLKDDIAKEFKQNTQITKFEGMVKKIKTSIIENSFKTALSTGNWATSKSMVDMKQGTSQALQRKTSFIEVLSNLRRVVTPSTGSSAAQVKKPEIRRLHPTSWGSFCCVTGDTQILLANGTTKAIKAIDENEDIIMSINRQTLEDEPTKIYNYFSKMPNKLYKITTVYGFSLKCTGDHPILAWKTSVIPKLSEDETTKYGTMINAEELKVNDMIFIRCTVENKHAVLIKSIEEIEPELVYDFTTVSDNHTLVANNFITSNCVETPEGQSIGLVKNLALTCHISIKTSTYGIREILSTEDIVQLETIIPNQIYENNYTKIFVDGDWYACTRDATTLVGNLREARRAGKLNYTISIVRDFELNEIRIYNDSGRCLQPLFIVDKENKLRITSELIQDVMDKKVTWEELLVKHKVIEFLSVQEKQYNALIAMNVNDLYNADPKLYHYTHCEIHPIAIMGVVAGLIPFSDHNQSPRNLFTSAQTKQSIGVYALNHHNRMDTKAYVLYYPEKPIINTVVADLIKFNDQPAGQNAIVAIMCYTGYNQEDSVMLNKSALDRGLYRTSYYKTYKEETKNEERFLKPDPKTTSGVKRHSSYEKINKDGFVVPGTRVNKNDIIIGKVHKIDRLSKDKHIEWKDNSVSLMKDDDAIIDRVIVDNNHEGYQFCKVKIRMERIPAIGDKLCLTEDHEVLTNKGWKFINKLTTNDEICTLKDNANLKFDVEYHKPDEIFKFEVKRGEPLYKIKSNQLDLIVTPNHKMYVKKNDQTMYGLYEAKDIYGEKVTYRKNLNNKQINYMFKYNKEMCKNDADRIQLEMLEYGQSCIVIQNQNDTYSIKECEDETDEYNEEIITNYEGYVYCPNVKNHIFYVRRNGIPVWTGNSSRHGQKGTCGMVYRQEDMPFTEDGIVPDIIINPHAIPSRMTIGQLIECVYGKSCSIHGRIADATPFNGIDVNDIADELEKLGFERHGNEKMYNGFTSEPMETMIFIGPTYYQRLQHIVIDKIHSRSNTGPDQTLVRQPLEGRSRDGGLRFGEMERDAMIAHGVLGFLKERFHECSDGHNAWFCNKCGNMAVANPNLNRFECRNCEGDTEVSNIELPYAMKLLIQEVMATGIIMRVIPEQNEIE